ncbi:hypothetical protein [Streptomyces afghaniensis]|uniref:hypothetical protein n=1 Tax=Streptomyces afghaniensis TaxID=66865 RepID=UPI0027D7A895|nr:hypothetical protein [Streptomyces afghaniensis]
MPVLDGQGHQPAWSAGNVPGQRPAETCHSERTERIVGDDFMGAVQANREAGDPYDEVLNAVTHRLEADDPARGDAAAWDGVDGAVEEEPVRGDAFQHTD